MGGYSIVEYCGRSVGRCGYCKQNEGSKNHGMWAHCLTVQDYQDIIDRGWRRSGKYCYKPVMNESCCKLYTIKCAALNLQLTKSQKKNIKHVNNFLHNGVKVNLDSEENHLLACGDQMSIDNKPPSVFTSNIEDITNSDDFLKGASSDICDDTKEKTSAKTVKQGVGPDLSKPPCKKAKILRMEKKKAKLLAKGIAMEENSQKKNVDKSLEDMMNSISDEAVHKLELRLTPTSEVLKQLNEAFLVYRKYQIAIHHDSPDKCDEEQFMRFLIRSPLQPSGDFGSYHQQYYLDGKLIAVGVIDILPSCVSSVYFYYDPDYGHMSLGTYGALRELMLVRQLNQKYPDLKYYYMGYYIHTCMKMRYKARLRPSFLLCPITYSWISIEKCLPLIEVESFSRLSSEGEDNNNCTENDLQKVNILWRRTVYPFQIYNRNKKDTDAQEVLEYAQLIGKTVSRRMLLYRHN